MLIYHNVALDEYLKQNDNIIWYIQHCQGGNQKKLVGNGPILKDISNYQIDNFPDVPVGNDPNLKGISNQISNVTPRLVVGDGPILKGISNNFTLSTFNFELGIIPI